MTVTSLTNITAKDLICPEGKSRVELCDRDGPAPGLYLEVRATSPGQGTYYLRYKDSHKKTCHTKIGRTTDITPAEARKRAKTLKAEIELGVNARTEKSSNDTVPTLSEFFEKTYLPEIKPRLRSWKKNEGIYRMYLKEKFGHLRLDQIRKSDFHAYHASLLGRGLSPGMSDHVAKVLRACLGVSVSFGVLPANPLGKIRMLCGDNRRDQFMSPEELNRLLTVLRTDANRPVCLAALLLISTGMRLNEALSAKWEDVDRQARTLRIAAATSKSKRIRSVPLNDAAMEVLDQLGTEGKSPYLFVSDKTNAKLSYVHKVWDRLRKKSGLPHLRIHDLRHQYASFLVNSGRSLYEVQKILGHSSHSVTERYAHLSTKSLQDAANSASVFIQLKPEQTAAGAPAVAVVAQR